MAGEIGVSVKLHADASQYTAEITKAGQLAQTFSSTLQAGGTTAAQSLQAATAHAEKLGTTATSSAQSATSSLSATGSAAQALGSTLQGTSAQAAQASQGLDGLARVGHEAAQSQQQSRTAGQALIAVLRDQIATAGKSAEELLRYRAAQAGVAAEASPLILQLQHQRAAQQLAVEAARQEEAAQREAAAVKRSAQAAASAFISGLQEQIAVAGKSADELLRYRAGLAGVATEAEPLIKKLGEQRVAQQAAAEAARQEEAAQREAAAAKQSAQAASAAFLASLRDQVVTTGMSSDELLRYRSIQAGVAAEAAPWIRQLQIQKEAQLRAAEAAQAEEAAQREAAAAKQRDIAAADAFVRSLRAQAETQGMSAAELLRYQAAQHGVSSSAAQYISAIEAASNANKGGAISAAQHAAAMRMLPMQMTDVVVSVASGMPIWMVLVQQGGQIKDSFGGAGAALRALVGAITPAIAGGAALAAGVGLAAAAYYQGSAEGDRYREAIVMSGNAAGVTVGQLDAMARAVGNNIGTQNEASRVLAEMTRSGQVGAESLQHFTEVAMGLEKYAGQSIQTTVQHLTELGKAPLQASVKLNEQYNYLTPAVYRQIEALEKQGRTEEAAAVAQQAYVDAFERRKNEMAANLGHLERLWYGLGNAAKWTWDRILNIGRPTTDEQSLAVLKQNLANLEERNARPGYKEGKQTQQLREEIRLLEEKIAGQKKAAQQQAEDAKDTKALAQWQRDDAQYKTRQAKRDEEIEKARVEGRELINKGLLTEADLRTRIANINEKYKDPKKPSGGGISVTDNELATIRSQLAAAQLYHGQLLALGPAASALNAGERESLKISEALKVATDAKTIARLKEKQVAADALGVQLRTNEGLEQSYKAHQQLIDTTDRDADAITQRAKEQAAANAVFGKGRTAIEQMTLAELEHQMAEAKGDDPKYIDALSRKIEAQKKWVDALGQADYKAVMQHADELLVNAQEMAQAYEDELEIASLTGLARERIVAQRAVELKYAKELEKINKTTLSDTEKQAAREQVLAARRTEMIAAAGRATQSYMAKASDEINRSLADALMRGFESGKGFAENLADTTENLFRTMVLRPVISAIVNPVSLQISATVQDGLNAVGLGGGAGSGMGGGNLLSGGLTNWSSWGSKGAAWLWEQGNSLMDAGWSQLGDSVMSLGSTVNSLNVWLKDIPGMSGGLGSAAGYLGSIYALSQGQYGSAVGSAIGTYIMPGIGTMVGGMLGGLLDGLLGDDDAPYYGASASWSAAKGTRTNLDMVSVSRQDNPESNIDNQFATGMGWVNDSEQMRGTLSGMAQTLGNVLDGFATAFGKKTGYEVSLGYADDSTDDNAWGALRIAQGDQSIKNWNDNRQTRWAPREYADGDAGWKSYLSDVSTATREVLLDMGIPDWAQRVLGSIGDSPGIEQLSAAINEIAKINTVFTSLGSQIDWFAQMSEDAQAAIMNMSGGIDALTSNAAAYYQAFYSPEEQRAALQRQLNDALATLDLRLPDIDTGDARAQWRALIEAQDGNTEAGQRARAMLLQLSGSFAQLTQETAGASNAMASLTTERRKLQAELLQAQGDMAGYRAAIRDIETESYTEAERSAWDYNRALRDQIAAAQDASRAAQEYADAVARAAEESARAAEEARRQAIDSALSAVERVIDRDKTYWSAMADGASQAISRISSAVDMLYRNADDLYGSVAANAAARAAAGMVYIESALDAVREGTSILKFKGLDDAVSAARGGVSNGVYATQFDRDRDALVLAGQLSELGGYADLQQSMEEKMLGAAQTQIDLLDEALSYYRDLVAGVEHVYDTGLEAVQAANRSLEGTQYVYGAIDAQTIAQRDLTLGLGDSISTATSESARIVSDAINRMVDASRVVPQEVIDQITATRDTTGAMLSLTGAIEALTGALALQQGGGSNSSSSVSWGGGSGSAGSSGGQTASRYTRSVVYSGGEAPMGVSDAQEVARLDALSAVAQPFHGTGDLPGLLTTVRAAGYTLSDLQAALSPMAEFKGATYSDWLKAAQSVGIPAFAAGGAHAGGLRVVGERGWELEATGPARIWNQQQLGQALSGGSSNAELVAEVRALREQAAQIAARLVAIERHTQGLPQLVDQHDSVTEGGNVGRSEITNADVLAQTLAKEIAKILEDA